MCNLTGMDVSNASLYEGASGLAEAVLMAARANRKVKTHRVLMPSNVHPYYRAVAKAICHAQGFEFVSLPYCAETGTTMVESLAAYAGQEIAALVIPQPNFFGQLETVDALTDWAHAQGALVIGVVNPIALALLKAPGQWGEQGADIVCGEGQPLGAPLSSGGPYYGFLCCKQQHVRQMPGRIVGKTVDLEDKVGYTLTLQAREQHIRRAKATSNICTNQGLVVTASTIHMALLGAEGLRRVASACWHNTQQLVDALCQIPGVERVFSGPGFHEAVLRLPAPADHVVDALSKRDILGGLSLTPHSAELGQTLLVCVTETKSQADIQTYVDAMTAVLA
jgi:glycine dehydrogenase subunit 1